MSHCSRIKSGRRDNHLRNAETHCNEARVIALRSPSIEGALGKVKDSKDMINIRRLKMKEEGKKRNWFGKSAIQRMTGI